MNPALQYAESTLGVHTVYEEAKAAQAELDNALTELDKAQDTRRALDDKISEYEMDLLIRERGAHADHSEAAMSRHLKEVYHKDETLKGLRRDRNYASGRVMGWELDVDEIKYRIKIAVARMEELGGYFQFLAACKLAEVQAEQTTQTTQEHA